MPTVAVVMGTYNGARYLGEQLASILAQTRAPDQVIVSDDGSSDDTVRLAREALVGFGGEVVIVANPGERGVVSNFANALSLATTELVALSDQDDVWHPDKLAVMSRLFEARPSLTLAHSDAQLVDGDGVRKPGTLVKTLSMSAAQRRAEHEGRAFALLMQRNFVTGATTVFRRRLLATALPVPPGWLHDEWFAIVAAAVGEMDLVERPLIDYRQHGGNEVGAQLLSTAGKARRMSEPRAERNARLLRRAEQLPPRLRDLAAAPGVVRAADERLEHERMRSTLPVSRARRLPAVVRALIAGRYRRYGRDGLDAVRDLIQPA